MCVCVYVCIIIIIIIIIIINEVLFYSDTVMNNITGSLYTVKRKNMKRNEVQPGKLSVTKSVQKAMSLRGSGMTEVMAHPWRLVEDFSKWAKWESRSEAMKLCVRRAMSVQKTLTDYQVIKQVNDSRRLSCLDMCCW